MKAMIKMCELDLDLTECKTATPVLPRVVYYSIDHSTTPPCSVEARDLFKCVYTLPTTWHSLIEELESGADFLLIRSRDIEASNSSAHEFIGMIESMIKFIPAAKNIKIGVVINKDTHLSVVKELQKTSVNGLLLDVRDFYLSDVLELNDSFLKGKGSWPKHIISKLPGNIKKISAKDCHLTARQQEVLPLICNRGLSNKQIAKFLNISESTVKIHVSAIMKIYAVRNRTQLALAASTSLKA